MARHGEGLTMLRLQIESVATGLPRGDGVLSFVGDKIPPLIVDRDYLQRFKPQKGGWFILTDANEASYEPPGTPC